jgi:hypothetical protein
MSEDQPKPRFQRDTELEREIRKERKFSLEEAIGRMAGPGSMKGASPVTREQQAEAEIQDYLRLNMAGGSVGCLAVVLLRYVMGSELLLSNLDRPLVVLAGYTRHLLESDYLLKELVRDTDVEWGRVYDERPYFDREGAPPHPDDPFTIESVRSVLSQLNEKLSRP